jgi:2-polyprenyl-3-methyl-5-hydroxy-6-metoxy-1,4-benzoquinol methylase
MQNHENLGVWSSAEDAYLLDNAGREAPARFAALSGLFDSGTIRHLEERGVAAGWNCWEVGGGGGSIATWLARRVGDTGRVLVTDIDPRFLETLRVPNLAVRRHNIVTDPLPEGTFDLIHARLVLVHIPQWEKVLHRLISALKLGGWLLNEEFDSQSAPPDPTVSPGEVLLKTHAAMGRLMADRGFERRYGRLLFGRLRAHGLVNVGAEARMFMVQRGSPGASLVRANYEQLRGAMIEAGYITAQEFDKDLAMLDEPDFMMPSSIMWAVWGCRP